MRGGIRIVPKRKFPHRPSAIHYRPRQVPKGYLSTLKGLLDALGYVREGPGVTKGALGYVRIR
jgi:hypothetical protein